METHLQDHVMIEKNWIFHKFLALKCDGQNVRNIIQS